MNQLIQDLLASMDSAVCNIQQDVMHKGFKGDTEDARAVLAFCRDYAFTAEDYALLHANSAEIAMGYMLVMRHTSDGAAQAAALKAKAFDYAA